MKLTTYSGKVDLYAMPLKYENLTNGSDYQIRPDSTEDLVLDINPWIRRHRLNESTGLYKICVKGEFTSTYTILVKEFVDDYEKSVLVDSYIESFVIRRN